jgi:hypothetical protein
MSNWVVWLLNLDGRVLGLANMYAPNDVDVRVDLWHWLTKYLLKVYWLMCGDFNDVVF